MQSSSTFMRISGPITEVKKSAAINDRENIVKNPSKAMHWRTSFVCSKYSGRSWRVAALGKFCNICPHLSLETVFAVCNYEHFFPVN